jgi:hypothetical protein
LMYEVPYASFGHAQVDVFTQYRQPDGPTTSRCLLTTRATREQVKYADWDYGSAEELLGEWETQETDGRAWPDPDQDAIILPGATDAVRAAEDALGGLDIDEAAGQGADRESDDAPREGHR